MGFRAAHGLKVQMGLLLMKKLNERPAFSAFMKAGFLYELL